VVKTLFLSLSLILIAPSSFAQCNFKTGEFIEELGNPISIKAIDIEIPKSAKWEKNFLKIVLTKSDNIPPSLKKSFSAKIFVTYSFGRCSYEGKVKQSGDWKDHISFVKGKPIRSVNVTLSSGNILNSVKFKLLIPETRYDLKEVFGVSLLSTLGFITPETFKVPVSVNGTETEMLFQEAARKELLERNNRREGPIFEGDETLLWGAGRLTNDDVALSRLVNDNWFKKGENSVNITLSSYQMLQKAYVVRANNIEKAGSYIDPNIFLDTYTAENFTFPEYHFVMQALGAEHALIPHNRQYYFNSFKNSFEPIYYDGMIFNHENTSFSKNIIERSFKYLDTIEYGSIVSSMQIKNSAQTKFKQRVNLGEKEAEDLFEEYWGRFVSNVEGLNSVITKTEVFQNDVVLSKGDHIEFLKRASQNPLVELLGVEIQASKGGEFVVEFLDVTQTSLTLDEISEIISQNAYGKRRATLVTNEKVYIDDSILRRPFLGGSLISNAGIEIQIDEINRKLILQQTSSADWAYIVDASIDNWSLEFRGSNLGAINQSQRFNSYGMTGCLNLHSSNFHEAEILVNDGGCEDSLNIVNSTGALSEITINRAYADALDLDFSNLKLNKVTINEAGNDCLDVSRGVYMVDVADLKSCGDKGISVGEASTLNASILILENANIGVSSKDLSKVEILKASLKDSIVCTEVMQKKQEFGGAYLNIMELNCSGSNNVDTNSVFLRGNL
jgi:hypothetical protein